MKPSKIILQHLYDQGMVDTKKLSKKPELPLRTVQRVLSKMKKGIFLERKVGSGCPKALNSQDTYRLLQLAVKDNMRTSTSLKLELEKTGSPKVSFPTFHLNCDKAEICSCQ